MGRIGYRYIALAIIITFAVAGCETVPKKFKEEVSGIKTKVETLESRVETVEAKQSDTERQASMQAQALEEMRLAEERAAKSNVTIRPKISKSRKESIRQIQTCLKNAGFYKGKINGVKTRATKRAIRQFQEANGLKVDGIVGKKTWELLTKYSSGPVEAPAASAREEGTTK